MKHSVKIAIFGAALLGVSSVSFAQDAENRGYFGINAAQASLESDAFDGDWSHPIAVARIGYQINPYIALEGRLGLALGDDSDDIAVGNDTVEVDAEIEQLFGGYIRLSPITPVKPYLIVGYTDVKAEVSAAGVTDDDTDGDFSYGVGVEFGSQVKFGAEYMNYYDDDDTEVTSLGVFAKWEF